MAIKKIDSFNKHSNCQTNQNPFDVENYLNVNWNKAQDVINSNADELTTAQNNISEIKQEQTNQDSRINKNETNILNLQKEQTAQNTQIEKIKQKNTEQENKLTDFFNITTSNKLKFNDFTEQGMNCYFDDEIEIYHMENISTRSGRHIIGFFDTDEDTSYKIKVYNVNGGTHPPFYICNSQLLTGTENVVLTYGSVIIQGVDMNLQPNTRYYIQPYVASGNGNYNFRIKVEKASEYVEEYVYTSKKIANKYLPSNISNLQEEQTLQNKTIEELQQENIEQSKTIKTLKEEKAELEKNLDNVLISANSSGEYVHLNDSAEYPCSIALLGNDKQEVTEQSANILDLTKITISEKVRVQIDSISANEIIFHNTSYNDNQACFLRFKTTLKKGTWYIRKQIEILTGTSTVAGNLLIQRTSDWKGLLSLDSNATKGSFTISEDTEVYFATRAIGTDETNVQDVKVRVYNMMFSQTDVDYVPFIPNSPSLDYTSEIQTVKDSVTVTKCNKNILATQKNSVVNYNGLEIKTDKFGAVTINGTSTTAMYIKLHKNLLEAGATSNALNWEKDKFKKGTYTFSVSGVSGSAVDDNISAFIRKTATFSDSYATLTRIAKNKEAKQTFELLEDTEAIVYVWLNASMTFSDFKFKLQLEIGNTATDFVEHKEESVAIPVQREMLSNDHFDRKTNDEVHTWLKITLDGTNVKVVEDNTNVAGKKRYLLYLFTKFGKKVKKCDTGTNKAYCTNLKLLAQGETYTPKQGFTIIDHVLYIYTDGRSAAEFNEYLKQNNITFYIPLEQESFDKLAMSQEQIKALEQLDKFKTYKHITNLTTDSIAVLDVEYKKDLETENKKIAFKNLLSGIIPKNAGAHNAIYRGNDITDKFYDGTLSTQIANQTFDDIFIGDYIIGKVSKRKYLVADINYRLNMGDMECKTPHILMIPERLMGTAKMNDTNITTGAYVGSKMYTEYLTPFKTVIQNDFETSHIVRHRNFFANAVTNGYEGAGEWFDSTIELMNEIMVYGSNILHNIQNGTNLAYNHTMDKQQLSLFRLKPDVTVARNDAGNRNWYWLRDVVSASYFAYVFNFGNAGSGSAYLSGGVRPAFLIK